MRILHTADWHLGKTLLSADRLSEQVAFIDELNKICISEKIDLVLIAGDIYQSVNPSAAAEELFYDAVNRLADYGKRGIVIIAGNHDNPERLCASSPLADKLGITLIGLPKDEITGSYVKSNAVVSRLRGGQGWFELSVPGCQHHAVIVALPYPSEGRLGELLANDVNEHSIMKGYNERIEEIFASLNSHFSADTVNIVMSHLYTQGGLESMSEQKIQSVGGAYAVLPSVFPKNAQYVALGHLHRPQQVANSPVPARYAGSPLAYSFSEIGYSKSVTIVDLEPGQKAAIKEVPLASGKPLVKWKATKGYEEVMDWINSGRDHNAWIDLDIYVTQPLTLKQIQDIRKANSSIVDIHPIYTGTEEVRESVSRESLSIDELFIRFFAQQTGGSQPDAELVQLFMQLTQKEEIVEQVTK